LESRVKLCCTKFYAIVGPQCGFLFGSITVQSGAYHNVNYIKELGDPTVKTNIRHFFKEVHLKDGI
jgi:hypothetical protein